MSFFVLLISVVHIKLANFSIKYKKHIF